MQTPDDADKPWCPHQAVCPCLDREGHAGECVTFLDKSEAARSRLKADLAAARAEVERLIDKMEGLVNAQEESDMAWAERLYIAEKALAAAGAEVGRPRAQLPTEVGALVEAAIWNEAVEACAKEALEEFLGSKRSSAERETGYRIAGAIRALRRPNGGT